MSSLTQEEIEELRTLTLEARDLSYSPYSKFRVGACILDVHGKYFLGANVENAAYSGFCAERIALVKAVTSKKDYERKFKAIGIAADGPQLCPPCGNCRQFLREFSTNLEVYMFTSEGRMASMSLEELLPMAFGPEALDY